MYDKCYYQSPLGELLLESDGQSLIGLWFSDQRYFGNTYLESASDVSGRPGILSNACLWLDRYFRGEAPEPSELPLDPHGTEFRRCIWKLLCEIPYGETVTYKDLAVRSAAILGKQRMAAQAVGQAVGHNPIGIIIPCHRVIGSDDSLVGYGGGLDKKIWLLTHEGYQIKKN